MSFLFEGKIQNIACKVFYPALGLWVFLSTFRLGAFPEGILTLLIFPVISRLLSAIVMCSCFIKDGKPDKKRSVQIIVYLVIGIMSLLTTHTTSFLDIFMVASVAAEVDYTKLLKTFLWAMSLATVVIFALFITGVLYTPRVAGRLVLGFNGEPALAYVLFAIISIITVLYWNICRKAVVIFDIVMAAILFIEMQNKTASSLLMLMIIFFEIVSWYRDNKQVQLIERKKIKSLVYLFPVIIIGIAYLFTGFKLLRDPLEGVLLSFYNRFFYGSVIIKTVGISIIGRLLQLPLYLRTEEGYLYMLPDDTFVLLPVVYGIIPYAFFIYMVYKTITRYIRKKMEYLLIIFLCVCCYSVMEAIFVLFIYSFVFSAALGCREGEK